MTRVALRGPSPSPRPPTCSRPHWNSSQHSLTRLTRATRGPSFLPAPARTRASTRRAHPPALRKETRRRGGSVRLPILPCLRPSPCCPSGGAGSPYAPGKAQRLFTKDPTNGDALLTTRPLLLSKPPQGTLLTHPAAPFPPPDPHPAKATRPNPFGKAASNSRSGGSSLPLGVNLTSPGSCGGWKGLFSAARWGLGR